MQDHDWSRGPGPTYNQHEDNTLQTNNEEDQEVSTFRALPPQ